MLGRAEAALGDTARALSHLHASVAIARRAGAGYEEAIALVELARVLIPSAATRQRRGRLLQRAIGILSSMGAAPDLAQALELFAVAQSTTIATSLGITFSRSQRLDVTVRA